MSIEQAGPPRFMRAGTKKIITGKAAADWRREAEAAAGEGRRDGSAEAAAVGHVPGRRHPANEIKQRTNASKTDRPSGRSRRSNQLSKGSGQPFAPQHGQGSHAGRRATLCETGPLHSLQRGRSTPVDEISSATVDKLAVANSTELLLLHIEVGG